MEHNQNNINNPLSSLFNKLFGKRKQETVTDNNDVKTSDNNDIKTPDKKDKSKVQDMVLISIADKYKVGEKNYPDYLRIEYGIGFPNEHFKTLEISGYIRASTAKETLNHLKLAEQPSTLFLQYLNYPLSLYQMTVPQTDKNVKNRLTQIRLYLQFFQRKQILSLYTQWL